MAADQEQAIRALVARYAAAANARDLGAAMRLYAATDSVLVYDVSNAPFRGFAEVEAAELVTRDSHERPPRGG